MRLVPCSAALAAAVVVTEATAWACPSCARGDDGTPAWLIAALLAAPLVIGAVVALVIRHVARGDDR